MTLNTNDDFYLAEKLAGVGHWRVEFPSQKIYWSAQIYVIHGVSPDEYEPEMKSAIEFYHPDDRAHVQKCVEQGLANKKDFEFSLRLVRPTGEIRYVRSKSKCLLDESGELTGLFGIFHDVTEQEERTAKTEQLLRANLNFQKLLMNVNSDLFFVKDEEFRIVGI